MSIGPLDFSTPPFQDKVLTQDGLTSRTWTQFIQWVKGAIVKLINGPLPVTQSDLVKTQENLTRSNVGLLVWVTDFNHVLRWSGSDWAFAASDSGSGYYVDFDPATPPTEIGWALCDGSTVDCLQADGSIISVTLPVTANRYFRV